MYLILYNVNDNATPDVFHDGADVIGLRIVEEEKGCRKRFDKEGPTEKIRLRRYVKGMIMLQSILIRLSKFGKTWISLTLMSRNLQKISITTRRLLTPIAFSSSWLGLNVIDEVRGRIIGKQPLPSLGEVFSEVRREESKRNVMLGKKGSGNVGEGSALAASSSSKAMTYQHRFGKKSYERPRVWCDYCDKPRHTRETCWNLHGKPAHVKGKGGEKSGRGIPIANEVETTSPRSYWSIFLCC